MRAHIALCSPFVTGGDRPYPLVQALLDIAGGVIDDSDVNDLLFRVTEHCVRLTGGGAAGVLLLDTEGRLRVAAVSTQDIRALSELAIVRQDGPRSDRIRAGQPVHLPDIAAEPTAGRDWAAAAIAEGFRSAYTVPMRSRDRVIGMLALLGTTPDAFGPADLDAVRALADMAAIAVLAQHAADRADALATQLQTALTNRGVIDRAVGVVAATARIGVDEAFTRLREHARRTNTRLAAVAESVLAGRLTAGAVVERRPAR